MADDLDDVSDDEVLTTGAIGFAQAWTTLIDDVDLSDGAVRLYLALSTHARVGRGSAFPRHATLAKRLECSVDSVQRRMAELEKAEWVDIRTRGQGRSNLVHINVPGGSRAPWFVEARSRRAAASVNRSAAAHRRGSGAGAVTSAAAASLPTAEVDLSEVDGPSSLGATTDADASTPAVAVSDSTTSPPVGPQEGLFQDGLVRGTIVTKAQFEHMDAGAKKMLLDALREGKPTIERRVPTPDVAAEVAPSVPDDPTRLNVIRRPEGLLRALERGHNWVPSSQADHRNVAKLLDLKPNLSQIDGAVEAVRNECGGKLDLGRLVSKWATYSQFGATRKRPEAWQTPRKREQDAADAHVAAGGNPYTRDGRIDYGV